MSRTDRDRIVDEMAVVLCGVEELGDDGVCCRALIAAGFKPLVVGAWLDEARDLAREAIAAEGDLWATLRLH